MSAPIDWAGLMRIGLRDLGLTPAQFWSLTPRELAVVAGREAAAGCDGAALAALMRAFPDDLKEAETTT